MLEALARWILSWLEQRLDPQLQSRVQALNEKIAAAEKAEAAAVESQRQSELALAASDSRRQQLAAQLDASRQLESKDEELLAESVERRKQIATELEANLVAIRDRPDADLLNKPLPGTTSDRH